MAVTAKELMPSKREQLLANIVSGHFQALKDAARAAGYAETTVQSKIYQIVREGSFEKALSKKRRKRTDIALRIADRAGEHLERALEREDADPALVLAAWRESKRIIKEDGIGEKAGISPDRIRWLRQSRLRSARAWLLEGMGGRARASRLLEGLNRALGLAKVPQDLGQEADG